MCISFLTLSTIILSANAADENQFNIKMGIFDNPPKISIDENGNVSGIYSALIENIAGKEGWTVDYVPCALKDCLEMLKRNEIDVLADIGWNEERAEYLEFNKQIVITNYGVVFTDPDFNPLSFRELEGKKVASLEGSVFLSEDGYPAIERLLGIKSVIVPVSDYETGFLLLENKSVDAVIANDFYGAYNKKIHPSYRHISTNLLLLPRDNFFAFPKNGSLNNLLIEKIDSNLIELKANEKSVYYQEMYRIRGGYKEEIIPGWLKFSLICIGVLLIISLLVVIALRKLNKVLDRRVKERTAELDRANTDLEKAYKDLKSIDEIKTNIINNVSHELRTPLTVIYSVIDSIEKKDKKERAGLLKIAKKAAIRQNRIIKNLIDISSIKASKPDLASMGIEEPINRAIRDLKMLCDKKIKITQDIPKGIRVLADISEIKHAFLNLLDNSVKFCDKAPEIRISAEEKKDFVEISIADNGIGIPQKYHKKIFEKLYQIDATKSRRFGGTGMGLAITKDIIEAHGGKIWFESKPGKGSTFYFTLQKAR
jgi:signal transduction histidine kinase